MFVWTFLFSARESFGWYWLAILRIPVKQLLKNWQRHRLLRYRSGINLKNLNKEVLWILSLGKFLYMKRSKFFEVRRWKHHNLLISSIFQVQMVIHSITREATPGASAVVNNLLSRSKLVISTLYLYISAIVKLFIDSRNFPKSPETLSWQKNSDFSQSQTVEYGKIWSFAKLQRALKGSNFFKITIKGRTERLRIFPSQGTLIIMQKNSK